MTLNTTSRMRVFHGSAMLALLAALLLFGSGCATGLFGEKEEEIDLFDDVPETGGVIEDRALEVGEVVVFEFRSDALWYDSPYLAFEGQQLVVRPHGNSRALNLQAMRFRIGDIPQMMNHAQPFTVTNPGRFYFTVNRKFLPSDHYKTVSAEIERVK